MSTQPPTHPRPRRYAVAVMLGTALAALGTAPDARAEPSAQAVTDIGRYCTTCWRNARLPVDAWGDCTQEVFARLLERVPADAWGQVLRPDGDERREFVRAIDAVKKRVQRARKGSPAVDGLADLHDGPARRLAEDREAVRAAADELLSPRQRRILQLSFDGWSAQEMADELGMPVERVSDEKYKAVRKLRAHLASHPAA